MINNLSNIYGIPTRIFDQDIKNLIFLDFRNSLGKFLPKYGIKNILASFIKYILFFIWIFIFRSKKKKINQEKIQLIIDDVDTKEIFWRLKKFAEKIGDYKVIVSYKTQEPKTYFWNKYKNLDISKIFNNFKQIFFFNLFKFILFNKRKNRLCRNYI